ncbi:MAG: carboxylating nicotinate-nucleotide diphosphorylase [Planctomycetes bacterium]|nr:carboxylating nicotinate-nucleotide diphosphorylase [Planctomycetota bacterium]
MDRDFQQLEWSASVEDDCRHLVRLAVREDLDRWHDWTTISLIAADTPGSAAVVPRVCGVVAGLRACEVVIQEMNARLTWTPRRSDGDSINAGAILAEVTGSCRDLLVCERLLLNLLGRLSGVATLTRQYVDAVSGTAARIYDTRKTTPGWRRLEKYAVKCGGGYNHRTGLFDAILIKDNHLAACGDALSRQPLSPAEAVRRVRAYLENHLPEDRKRSMLIEVEVDTLEQLNEVLPTRPNIVLLDNMPPQQLREAVVRRDAVAPDVQLEASGGITLLTIAEIAATGVERISVGALTHSAIQLDCGLDWL